MKQTKLGSLVESLVNIAIGFTVAFFSQILIFPLFGLEASIGDNLGIGACFTVISLIRSYIIRRWFNTRIHRAAQFVAEKSRVK